jgi:hypothetical protein
VDHRFSLESHAVLSSFAKSTRSPMLMNFILSLDRVDRWAVDYDEFNADNRIEIQEVLRAMEDLVQNSVTVLHRVPRQLSEILAYFTTSRCIHLIRHISEKNPEFMEQFTLHLDDLSPDDSVALIAVKRRLEALSKAKVLGDLFSGKRLERITAIMRTYANV